MVRRPQDDARAAHPDDVEPDASSRLGAHFAGASATVARLHTFVARLTREHPFLAAIVIVAVGATAGYVAAAIVGNKRGEILFTASTTLFFAGLIGGVVKLLLDDVQRERVRAEDEPRRARALRGEQSRFITAVLADLESVYDRVERVRILVKAHRSALTYGKEMRDLIDATVQLRNVTRALGAGTSGISADILTKINGGVSTMERYLEALVDEFTTAYKRIADKQRLYEAAFTASLDAAAKADDREAGFTAIKVPENAAWTDLEELSRLQEFRRAPSHDASDSTTRVDDADSDTDTDSDSDSDDAEFDYRRDFVKSLDEVSMLLRFEQLRLANAQ